MILVETNKIKNRETNIIYFSGATFQACLHEYNILKFLLH